MSGPKKPALPKNLQDDIKKAKKGQNKTVASNNNRSRSNSSNSEKGDEVGDLRSAKSAAELLLSRAGQTKETKGAQRIVSVTGGRDTIPSWMLARGNGRYSVDIKRMQDVGGMTVEDQVTLRWWQGLAKSFAETTKINLHDHVFSEATAQKIATAIAQHKKQIAARQLQKGVAGLGDKAVAEAINRQFEQDLTDAVKGDQTENVSIWKKVFESNRARWMADTFASTMKTIRTGLSDVKTKAKEVVGQAKSDLKSKFEGNKQDSNKPMQIGNPIGRPNSFISPPVQKHASVDNRNQSNIKPPPVPSREAYNAKKQNVTQQKSSVQSGQSFKIAGETPKVKTANEYRGIDQQQERRRQKEAEDRKATQQPSWAKPGGKKT